MYVNSRLFTVAKTFLSKALRIMWCRCWNEPSNSSMIESFCDSFFKLAMQVDGEPPVMGNSLPPDLCIYLRTDLTIRNKVLSHKKTETLILLHYHLVAHRNKANPFAMLSFFSCLKNSSWTHPNFLFSGTSIPGSSKWFSHTWFSIHSSIWSLFPKIGVPVITILLKRHNWYYFVWPSQKRGE